MSEQEIVKISIVEEEFGWTFCVDVNGRQVVRHYVSPEDGVKINAYLEAVEGLIQTAMARLQ